MTEVKLYNENCLETMKSIKDNSIDLLLQDTPFGLTQNEWDVKPDFNALWPEGLRIAKENAAFVFFGQQPFTTDLTLSMRKYFRYDIVWQKKHPKGFLNSKKMPLRSHESILVFYKSLPAYNPQMTTGHTPVNSYTKRTSDGSNYGKTKVGVSGGGCTERYPKSVLTFGSDTQKSKIRPTQKPVELLKWLINTYSNIGDNVFDGFAGSCTAGLACKELERNFIGSELNKEYFTKARGRLSVA